MPRRRYALILGFLVLLGLAVRVAFVFSYQEILEDRHAQLPPGSDPPLIGDSSFYFWVGRQIADGDGFVRPFELREHDRRVETAERPPLYPLVLAIPSALGRRVGGDAIGLGAAGTAISGANGDAVSSGRQLGSWQPACFSEDLDRALAGGEVVDTRSTTGSGAH